MEIVSYGLGACALDTWSKKSHRDGNLWLREESLLPTTCQARISVFDYGAWIYHSRSKLENCANELSAALKGLRHAEEGKAARPLIFIGHSFGGLICANVLEAIANQHRTHVPRSPGCFDMWTVSDDMYSGCFDPFHQLKESLPRSRRIDAAQRSQVSRMKDIDDTDGLERLGFAKQSLHISHVESDGSVLRGVLATVRGQFGSRQQNAAPKTLWRLAHQVMGYGRTGASSFDNILGAFLSKSLNCLKFLLLLAGSASATSTNEGSATPNHGVGRRSFPSLVQAIQVTYSDLLEVNNTLSSICYSITLTYSKLWADSRRRSTGNEPTAETLLLGSFLCTLVIVIAAYATRNNSHQPHFLAICAVSSTITGASLAGDAQEFVFRFLFMGLIVGLGLSLLFQAALHARRFQLLGRPDYDKTHAAEARKE